MNKILLFGKYRGEKLENVFRNDPNYINWLKDQHFIDNILRIKINILLERAKK